MRCRESRCNRIVNGCARCELVHGPIDSGRASYSSAQSTTATRPGQKGSVVASSDAIRESKLDAAAVDRGAKLFTAKCGDCHGNSAKGTDLGPNLIYSMVLLLDDRGEAIAPVLRNGRPDQGMPKPDLTESEISDLVNWLHAQVYAETIEQLTLGRTLSRAIHKKARPTSMAWVNVGMSFRNRRSSGHREEV